jgi:hypothetical protein
MPGVEMRVELGFERQLAGRRGLVETLQGPGLRRGQGSHEEGDDRQESRLHVMVDFIGFV